MEIDTSALTVREEKQLFALLTKCGFALELPADEAPKPVLKSANRRGRPRKADPISPAEASRRYRAKKKAERHED